MYVNRNDQLAETWYHPLTLNLMENSLKEVETVLYMKSSVWQKHHLAGIIHVKKKKCQKSLWIILKNPLESLTNGRENKTIREKKKVLKRDKE